MNYIEKELVALQEQAERTFQSSETLRSYKETLEKIEGLLGEEAYKSISAYPTWAYAYYSIPVSSIPAEMTHILENLEWLVPIEAWTSIDNPENRVRNFQAVLDSGKLTINLAARLRDDALCEVKILGYTTQKRSRYIELEEQVPITQLICPEVV